MPDVLTITLNPAVDVSTTVARVTPTHKLRCRQERRDAGGGGINVARVINRLGGDVLAAYPAGGPIGEFLQRLVEAEATPSFVIPISGDTRESFTVVEDGSHNEFRFILPGPTLSAEEFSRCLTAIETPPAPRFIVASGSLPPGAPSDAYARMAVRAKARGARFVLDASGDALRAALEEGLYLIKPNLRELQELTGESLDDEAAAVAAAQRLVRSGQSEIVALSQGAKGATLITGADVWKAEAISAPIASSVGAGDSFLGALVWALTRGEPPSEAFRYALAAGAAALLRPGTELCRREDVMRLAALAQPRPI